ncbi:hypothetical protein SD70_22475 [Gordoniibacillus kamchatkensis]|uniref:Uncharacterized protein n=1 Tax=Gordoniibacillus kamchatkensis TaxID=1590651 RepID=A0ABR5ADG5_9BACL|nr:hypothetical protein [Paenibacillus sp. VKM B-2647]KIL39086.1 hypothetical protein SD70_22475 [Paenibacillus sp. VKM B-2647]
MGAIQDAKFVQLAERGDVKYADIEVRLSGHETPLLASFAWNGGDPQLASVYRKEASRELDWYDNSLHSAYVDLTAELFDNGRGELGIGSRDDFAAEVLSHPNVRRELGELGRS